MATLRKILMALIAPIYSLLVALMILALSSSSYEFMIGEVYDGEKMTYCNLPTESDDASGLYATFTGILVLSLLVVGAVRSYRARRVRISLVCGVLLSILWVYLFFLRSRLDC